MAIHWIWLALLSAFLLATADAWTKRHFNAASASSQLIVRFGISGMLLLPFWLAEPWPDLPWQFWAWILPALPLEVGAMVIYIRALQSGRLSHTLPFMAFTPALVALTGWLLLQEQLNLHGLIGILLTVVGAWFLFLAPGDMRTPRGWTAPFRAIFKEPSARAMLGVAAVYALTAVLGRGALQHAPALWLGLGYFVWSGAISFVIVALWHRNAIVPVRAQWLPALFIGVCMAGMVVAHFVALKDVETAYMITIKRTSLLFAMLYGAWLFREPGLRQNLFAGVVMLAGVALVAWPA